MGGYKPFLVHNQLILIVFNNYYLTIDFLSKVLVMEEKYTNIAVLFHWLTAVLVIVCLLSWYDDLEVRRILL